MLDQGAPDGGQLVCVVAMAYPHDAKTDRLHRLNWAKVMIEPLHTKARPENLSGNDMT